MILVVVLLGWFDACLLIVMLFMRRQSMENQAEVDTLNEEIRELHKLNARIMAARVVCFPDHPKWEQVRIGDIYEAKLSNPHVVNLDGYSVHISV